MVVNNISKDMVLKKKVFKLMEDATKRGYWTTHSIVVHERRGDNVRKKLVIEIQEFYATIPLPVQNARTDKRIKMEQEILEVIKDNPGIQTKKLGLKLERTISRRGLSYVLQSLLERKLVQVKSVNGSKSDPRRQYYPAGMKVVKLKVKK